MSTVIEKLKNVKLKTKYIIKKKKMFFGHLN